jgi:methionyl-tRNA formyltransferase
MTARKNVKLAVFAAFAPGRELLEFVLGQECDLRLVATSDRDTSAHEAEMAALCARKGVECLRRVDASSPATVAALRERGIELAVLLWWPSIVKGEAIRAVPRGWVNLHPSLLPYNRGKHPYYWSIVEGTPFGVTLHLIDEGVDTGPILFQKEIPVRATDTGESLYQRGLDEIVALFKERFAQLAAGEFKATPQDAAKATSHLAKQLDGHSHIDLARQYRGGELIDIIRARTFMKGESAFFHSGGKRYRIKAVIEEA